MLMHAQAGQASVELLQQTTGATANKTVAPTEANAQCFSVVAVSLPVHLYQLSILPDVLSLQCDV